MTHRPALYNQKHTSKPCPRRCGNRIDNVVKDDNVISEVDGVLICGRCAGEEIIQAHYNKIRNRNGTSNS